MNIISALLCAVVVVCLFSLAIIHYLKRLKRQVIKNLTQFIQEQNSKPVRLEMILFSPASGEFFKSESYLYSLLASRQATLVLANGAEFIFNSGTFLCVRKYLKIRYPDMQEITVYQEDHQVQAAQ